jgi:hypothetical protein
MISPSPKAIGLVYLPPPFIYMYLRHAGMHLGRGKNALGPLTRSCEHPGRGGDTLEEGENILGIKIL